MNRKSKILQKLLVFALVMMLGVTAAFPAFAAAAVPGEDGDYSITINNAEGLSEMVDGQFSAYQLFTGTPHKESEKDPAGDEWGAAQWNNWTLADVEWGANIRKTGSEEEGWTYPLLDALKDCKEEWALDGSGTSVFARCTSAADVADELAKHTQNAFLQGFSKFVMTANGDGSLKYLDGAPTDSKAHQSGTEPHNAAEDTSVITVDHAGYYLIAETKNTEKAVSEYILAVLGNQVINIKASLPTVDKEIVTPEGPDRGDTAGVGDTVTYKLTGTLPENFMDYDTYTYRFNDTLSKGLTYLFQTGEDVAAHNDTLEVIVTIKGTKYKIDLETVVEGVEATGTGYVVSVEADTDEKTYVGGTLVTISFKDLKKLQGHVAQGDGWAEESTPIPWDGGDGTFLADDVVIEVTYDAQLNDSAVIGSAGNPNEVTLTYSNNPNSDSTGETTERKVSVYSFALDLKKVGSDAAKAEGLSGAGFKLSRTVDGTTQYATFKDDLNPGREGQLLLSGWVDSIDDATELTSGTNGKLPQVNGLDAGTYTLTETTTPRGYNTMDPITFTIKATLESSTDITPDTLTALSAELAARSDDDVRFENGNPTSGVIAGTLTNQKAPFLPFTGGIGTVIFYVAGGLLLVGALAYLTVSACKRRNKPVKEENA